MEVDAIVERRTMMASLILSLWGLAVLSHPAWWGENGKPHRLK